MGVLLIILSRGLGRGRVVFNHIRHVGGQFLISVGFMHFMHLSRLAITNLIAYHTVC